MKYDKEKRLFLTKKLIKLGSATLVQRAWRSNFTCSKAPSRSRIQNIVSKLEKSGSLNDIPPFHSTSSEKRENAKNTLKILFSENPSLSIRKASTAAGISYSLTREI